MGDILVQLLRSNACFFFSDLSKLYRLKKLESEFVPVRRFKLAAWGQVLAYLAGAPLAVSSYEEVERLLIEHGKEKIAAESVLQRDVSLHS